YDRNTLDFYSITFDNLSSPLTPGKYGGFECPDKPVIAHEAGNFVTFPRIDQIDVWVNAVKPVWLEQTREKLEEMGLFDEWPVWSENSEKLYLLMHKINTEAIRKSPDINGYHWWLFQEYWEKSDGLVDAYFRPKSITPEQVRPFNSDLVILQEGLKRNYRTDETLEVSPAISNYSPVAGESGKLTCIVSIEEQILFEDSFVIDPIDKGLVECRNRLSFSLPEVAEPKRIKVAMTLDFAGNKYSNHWDSWLYPLDIEGNILKNVEFFVSS
ncbi:unnamed protein product, partial [marine sediment metagenome]